MDDHFNEALKILKNQPNDLDLIDATAVGLHLISSSDQEKLIDIVSTRSLEDRILIFACLAQINANVNKNINNENKKAAVSISHCLYAMKQRDAKLSDIDQISPEDAQKNISGLIDLTRRIKDDLSPIDKYNAIRSAVRSFPDLFSPKSVYMLTITVLSNYGKNNEQRSEMPQLLLNFVLRGRRML